MTTLNQVWHRLQLWPDALDGLSRLKVRFIIAPLPNANVALMTNLSKQSRLPWTAFWTASSFATTSRIVQSAADSLGLAPSEVMMVAAHLGDLGAARVVGLRAAFVVRPLGFGSSKCELNPDQSVDVSASDFNDLAEQLGA